ncbi:MAG: sigma-54 dependent transcriptional regulator [Blastocatellia bacterium]|nr:sigma-54 dependent transcriptional regulator [Blastocatellia bacterium]
MSNPHLLIIDDENSIRLMLKNGLAAKGFRVTCARNGREGVEVAGREPFDAVLSDIFMPGGNGLDVVRELRSIRPEMPIILMTAQGSLDLAVRAVAEGATDFIAKPFEVATIAGMLRRCLDARNEIAEVDESEALAEEFSRSGLIGRSPAMVRVYKLIAHAARTEATVLITGESGTGKELAARAIHDLSARARRPFVAVNCAGLTDTLLESELFGHIRGSFTGATADREGLFEAADGGTIFLDELASTSAAFQASLLRVLQFGEVRRVGTTHSRRVDVRVIGASNVVLSELAKTGGFRSDLYYRLSVLTIDLPPLRQRQGDIELLARHFLKRASGEAGHFHLTRDVMAALAKHDFPGNVRELENALTRAVALSTHGLITLDCLPPEITGVGGAPPARGANSLWGLADDLPTIDELQRRYLAQILEEVGGNRRRTAEILGLNLRTIQRLISRYQLNAPADDEQDAALAGMEDETEERGAETE